MLKDDIETPRQTNDMSLPFTTPLNSTMINDESAGAAASTARKKPSQEATQEAIENRREEEEKQTTTQLRRSNLTEKLNRLSADTNEKLNDFVSMASQSQSTSVKERRPNVSSLSQSRDSGLISSPENLLGVS